MASTTIKNHCRDVDIIVPVYNLPDLTGRFIESVISQGNDLQLIIIDNGSDRETQELLRGYQSVADIHIIRNENNLGYVKAINQGLAISNSRNILLGNNDTIFTRSLLNNLLDGLKHYDIISPLSNNIGPNSDPRLIAYGGNNSIKHIEEFASKLQANVNDDDLYQDTDFVFGHCLLMKRAVFEQLGFLDERFGVGNYDDVDYCTQARRAGLSIGIRRDCFIYHECHATFDELGVNVDDLIENNKQIFEKKWKEESL